MTPLNPATAASHDLAQDLAAEIIASQSEYWGTVPVSFVVMEVRAFLGFCEECAILEPQVKSQIVRAVFAPSFATLGTADRDYVVNILCNTRAEPAARAQTIELALA